MSPEEIRRRHRHALSRLVPRTVYRFDTGEPYTVHVEPDADPRFIDSLCEALDMGPYVPVREDPSAAKKEVQAKIDSLKKPSRKRAKGPATMFADLPEDQYSKET